LWGTVGATVACGDLSAPPPPAEPTPPPPPDPLAPRPTGAPPRNVVLVLTDDQRWDTFGFLGKPWLPTPHLDALAASGAHASEHFVTTSLCCPSRASMFTGLYAHAHGVLDNSAELDPSLPTWQAIARRAGARTIFVGKWHMGGANPHPRPDWDRWIGFRGQGQYVWPGPPGQDALDRIFSFDGEPREVEGYVTDLLTDHAIEELRSPALKEPFVLLLSHKACHAPFVPAPRHRDLLADIPVPAPLPDTDAAYAELPDWLRGMRRETIFGVERLYAGPWRDFASWYRDYHRTVLAIDDSVGRIAAALDELGLRDRTAVLYTSDNGFMHGEKGVLDKRNFYEPSVRIPLLAHAPGLIPAGGRLDRFTLNVDIGPTVLDLLGLQAPDGWHGRSMLPLLKGESVSDWRQEFVYEYFFERAYPSTPTIFGLRTKRMKLSTYFGLDTPDELFDLEADPEERNNVIDEPSYAERRQAMRMRLRRHATTLGLRWEPAWATTP
jgi:N-acetylglucosamine-6-sulfatase